MEDPRNPARLYYNKNKPTSARRTPAEHVTAMQENEEALSLVNDHRNVIQAREAQNTQLRAEIARLEADIKANDAVIASAKAALINQYNYSDGVGMSIAHYNHRNALENVVHYLTGQPEDRLHNLQYQRERKAPSLLGMHLYRQIASYLAPEGRGKPQYIK